MIELEPSAGRVFAWLSAACSGRLVTPAQLRSAVRLRSKMRWRAEILVALSDIADGVLSNLERNYVRNVELPHGLPKPKRQVRKKRNGRSAYLDILFEEFGVLVELDGDAYHPAEARWKDIHRDNYFASNGIITLRYSWVDTTMRPCEVAREIGQVLRTRGWTGTVHSCRPSCSRKSA